MPTAWPSDLPFVILREGASRVAPDKGLRSTTDSGIARQRQQFTAVQRGIAGNIPLSAAQVLAFEAFVDDLAGGTFTYPEHPLTLAPAEGRFVVGKVGPARPDTNRPRWLMPVEIEFL